MNIKSWLEWPHIKNTFLNYFWNFHYIVIFGVLTTLLSLGIVTIGPAVIAMCSCTRLAADDLKVDIKFYFRKFKESFFSGMILSIIIVAFVICIGFSYNILEDHLLKKYSIIAYVSLLIIMFYTFLLFYFPFAAYKCENVKTIIKKSIEYSITHIFDTIIQISIIYLLWKLMSLCKVFIYIIYFPTAAYIVNSFILANNKEIDDRNKK